MYHPTHPPPHGASTQLNINTRCLGEAHTIQGGAALKRNFSEHDL
ncbi:MAG TPA: hypothetical protein VFQ47_04545 [Nitrososphaera sp.]|nr:hypothetical protein [Nitrososphaera sp.]